ncbi:SPOR domain-containing protein [Azospirillum halopraeferens]|uniref:SPOR domain-containing protein n=1 Tax=Azospirillum halopraeferens TaxID=34010 RepID=UPI000419931F|nr:SPOR domain-containing protein [Azospirillum halopraeferens]
MIRGLPTIVSTMMMAAALTAAAGAAEAPPTDRDRLAREALGLMVENAGPGQAEALLGVLYLRGGRIEVDPVAAAAWLERAADSGHPAGIYAAARIHAEGIGVRADPERARALLARADPAAFGPLEEAVRQLRLALDMPPAPAEAAGEPEPQPEAVTVAPPPPVPEPAAPPEETPVAPVTPPAPGPEPESPAAPAPTDLPSPAYAQLATLFSEEAAQSEVRRLRGLIPPPLMEGRTLTVRQAQLSDGRTAWRVIVSGFAGRDDARTFCGHVTAGGTGCIARGSDTDRR